MQLKLKTLEPSNSPNFSLTLDFILRLRILKFTKVDFHMFPSAVSNGKLWPSTPLQGLLCSYLCISEVPLVSLHMQKARPNFLTQPPPPTLFVGGILFSIVWLLVLAKVIHLTVPEILCLLLYWDKT